MSRDFSFYVVVHSTKTNEVMILIRISRMRIRWEKFRSGLRLDEGSVFIHIFIYPILVAALIVTVGSEGAVKVFCGR